MAIQTNYTENMPAGVPGAVVNMEAALLVSRNVEDEAGFGFGVPVQQGVSDSGATAIAAGATEVIGITVLERSVSPNSPNAFGEFESARLIRKGVIWVTATDAVDVGDEVWVNLSDGTFTNADAGTSGSIQLAGSRWDDTAPAGGIAKLRLNLDVPAVAGA